MTILAEARGASNHISGWRARWLPFILPWLHSFRLMILGRNAGTVMLVIGVIMFSLPGVGLGLGVAFIAIGSVYVPRSLVPWEVEVLTWPGG